MSGDFMDKKMKKLVTKEAWEVVNLTTDRILEELVNDNYDDRFLGKLKIDALEELLKSEFDRLLDLGKYFRYLLNIKIVASFTDDDTGEINHDSMDKIVGNMNKFVTISFINFLEKIMITYASKIKRL